jgi:glycosyltransferase A (GT-A) superfamily protein (DUF2064 family)
VAEVAGQVRGAQAYWAVAEANGVDAWPGLPVVVQGEGALGERLAQVQDRLLARHPAQIFLGADTPQLTAASVERAVRWLAADPPRHALGPALDGGFWLYGGNRALPHEVWQAPAYGSARAAADLRAALGARTDWLELEALGDVDHHADLAPLAAALAALPEPTPAQRRLLDWMQTQT